MSDADAVLPQAVYVVQDQNNDIEVIITVWPNGSAEYATRPLGSTWSWGPPIEMESR